MFPVFGHFATPMKAIELVILFNRRCEPQRSVPRQSISASRLGLDATDLFRAIERRGWYQKLVSRVDLRYYQGGTRRTRCILSPARRLTAMP